MTELTQYLGLLVAIATFGLQLAIYLRSRRPPDDPDGSGGVAVDGRH